MMVDIRLLGLGKRCFCRPGTPPGLHVIHMWRFSRGKRIPKMAQKCWVGGHVIYPGQSTTPAPLFASRQKEMFLQNDEKSTSFERDGRVVRS